MHDTLYKHERKGTISNNDKGMENMYRQKNIDGDDMLYNKNHLNLIVKAYQ